ncbi:MAG: response regulator [Chloroflexota bacterium]
MMMIKLLIAEDTVVARTVWRLHLQRISDEYEIVEVGDGAEAIELARREHFDVILMDVRMPIINGIEAVAEIRKISKVPIIMLSAFSDRTTREQARLAGANLFLDKLVSAEQIHEAIVRQVALSPQVIMPEMSPDSLRIRLGILYKNLDTLNEQKAQYGIQVPLELVNKIEAVEAEIEEIETILS